MLLMLTAVLLPIARSQCKLFRMKEECCELNYLSLLILFVTKLFHQGMELFDFGAQGLFPPRIPLDGSRSTTTVSGETSVTTPISISLKRM